MSAGSSGRAGAAARRCRSRSRRRSHSASSAGRTAPPRRLARRAARRARSWQCRSEKGACSQYGHPGVAQATGMHVGRNSPCNPLQSIGVCVCVFKNAANAVSVNLSRERTSPTWPVRYRRQNKCLGGGHPDANQLEQLCTLRQPAYQEPLFAAVRPRVVQRLTQCLSLADTCDILTCLNI